MAFMNAMGFDDEPKDRQMHPVRVRVREMLAIEMQKHPKQAQTWKRHYDKWNAPSFVYQDLSLTLTPDYPFAFIRTEAQMHYKHAARRMKEFPAVLNEFWRTIQLDRIWSAVKPAYLAELRKYDMERMNSEMAFLWSYLRMPRRDSFVIVSVPNLLDEHYSAIGANYGDAYFSVESPGALSYGLNFHEYLHSIANPLVRVNFKRFRPKLLAHYNAMKSSPAGKTYGDLVTYVCECLVRALDKRIIGKFNGIPEEQQRSGELATIAAIGLGLATDFHVLLAGFENSQLAFDQYMPVMLGSLPEYRPKVPARGF